MHAHGIQAQYVATDSGTDIHNSTITPDYAFERVPVNVVGLQTHNHHPQHLCHHDKAGNDAAERAEGLKLDL